MQQPSNSNQPTGPNPPPDKLAEKISLLDEAEADQALSRAKRRDMIAKIADVRWRIAQYHRTEHGTPLDFDRWPFLKEPYQSDAEYLVLYGSVGYGKTHLLIVNGAAAAYCGLRVFHVMENANKRDKFVTGVVDPIFREVPLYQRCLDEAKERNATVDSARFKHFSKGSLNFVGAETDADFNTYRADMVEIDEHQGCNRDNLNKVFNRMTGSEYGFVIIAGNPREIGSDENQNLDWEWKQTDMRRWHVPCLACGHMQVLGWWSHFIEEVTNEYGATLSLAPRDPEWNPDNDRDFRPICTNCQRPMNRLSRDGKWIPTHPGRWKRGYQLSSLYNPTTRMNRLLDRYRNALHDPSLMADFRNNQLGEAYTSAGTMITDNMLEMASTGTAAGVEPYRLVPSDAIGWRSL